MKFVKKHLRHVGIIMLSRMYENFMMLLSKSPRYRRSFDKLWSCSNDSNNFQIKLPSVNWLYIIIVSQNRIAQEGISKMTGISRNSNVLTTVYGLLYRSVE